MFTCSWTKIPPIALIYNQDKQLRVLSNNHQTGGPFSNPNIPIISEITV